MSGIGEPQLSAWRGVLNAHSTVVGEVEAALARAGLPPLTWYDVLWALRRAPGRQLRMGELAASLTISRGGLTKLVDRLEEAGLLRREPCPSDRRGYLAVLEPEGTKLLRKMWPVYSRELERAFASHLSEAEAQVISEALARVGAGS